MGRAHTDYAYRYAKQTTMSHTASRPEEGLTVVEGTEESALHYLHTVMLYFNTISLEIRGA